MGATADLAAHVAGTRHEDLGPAAIAAARRLVLDGLAVALAGTTEEPAPGLLWEVQKGLAAAGRASVIGFGATTQPVAAAYVNGASMHVLDFEAMWSPPNHSTSTTLPALLALAEERGFSGREVLTALVVGVEVQGRLLLAGGVFEPRRLRFHPPGAVGPLGSAAASARLLGLDAGRTAHAIGIAASRAGALLANVGSMTKCVHCGLATAGGLEAALLAERGFTAGPAVIEAPNGYAAALFGPGWDESHLARPFGGDWRIADPGYAIKMFPCQYGTHFAVTAALEARRRIADPALIEQVVLDTPAMPYVDRPAPRTGLDGKFSFQYTAACALLDGAVRIDSFHDSRRFAPDMEALLPRIRLEQDPGRPASFNDMHLDIRVRLKDGSTVEARCEAPRGYLERGAPISDAEHMGKITDCLARRLDDKAIARVAGLCHRLDELPAAGIAELMGLLRGA